jgi:hypothetical protein
MRGKASWQDGLDAASSPSDNGCVRDLLPGNDGFDDRKGWDRASIAYRSRKPYVPNVSRQDLLLPSGPRKMRVLGLCAVCAFAMTVLYVAIPLLILGVFVSLGSWDGIVLAGALLTLTVLLFFAASYEDRRLKHLAREL